MSWFRAASEIPIPGDQDVFDEEADESLLVQREWQGHMRKRVQVNGRDPGRAGKGTPTWDTGAPASRGTQTEAWAEESGSLTERVPTVPRSEDFPVVYW